MIFLTKSLKLIAHLLFCAAHQLALPYGYCLIGDASNKTRRGELVVPINTCPFPLVLTTDPSTLLWLCFWSKSMKSAKKTSAGLWELDYNELIFNQYVNSSGFSQVWQVISLLLPLWDNLLCSSSSLLLRANGAITMSQSKNTHSRVTLTTSTSSRTRLAL